jgi:3-oxoacyl-[acyl-carrier-protein] synthase-3
MPLTAERLEQGKQHFVMQGREVFKLAVRGMAESSLRALDRAGLGLEDIALVVPHQANLRIIEAAAKRLGVPLERFLINLDRYGNTSAATIPIGLVEAAEQGRLKAGDHVLVTAFGGGLTWGSAVIRWG